MVGWSSPIGDVTGHGMSAAFLMATTQLLVRNTMVRLGDPGRCLEEVNRQLCVQVFNEQFVTMSVMILDVVNGQMHVATAGHPRRWLRMGSRFNRCLWNRNWFWGLNGTRNIKLKCSAFHPKRAFCCTPTAWLNAPMHT